MTNRFDFTQGELGRELLTRSSELKIKMYRIGGKLCAHYTLRGCVGKDPFEDDDEDEGDLLAKRKTSDADDMRFIVDLMTQFEREH